MLDATVRTQLKTYLDATLDPASNQAVPAQAWIADSASGVFTGSNAIQTAACTIGLA